MTNSTPDAERFDSDLLEAGAVGYAAAAATLLLERHPETAARFGDSAFRSWKGHLSHRARQLSGALLVAEPSLFAADVAWSQTSFGSRDVPVEDLRASLECLRDTLAEELPAASAEHATHYVETSLEALAEQAESTPAVSPGRDRELALQFLEAAMSGERRRAIEAVLGAVGNGLTVAAAYTEVLAVAQRIAGDLWHQRGISVPQEHCLTETVRDVMALLAHEARRAEPRGLSALVAVAPGNAHEIAARALADLLEIDGWRAVNLGGTLPASDLALALAQFEIDLLCLSIALSTQLRGARAAIEAARAAKPGIKILVGGGVLLPAPELWRRLGADAGTVSLEKAVDVAAGLCAAD